MRTAVGLGELQRYQECPEKEHRWKLSPAIDPLEAKYQEHLRTLLVRFYGELMGGITLSEKELRRSWSTMWEVNVGLVTRVMDKTHASMTGATMTPEERMILRGAGTIHALVGRSMHINMKPLIVDEPFSFAINEQTSIIGYYDLVFEDHRKQLWIMDWTSAPGHYLLRLDRRHAVLIEALHQKTGKIFNVLVDYIRTAGDVLEPSTRNPDELTRQIEEAKQMATGLAMGFHYRSIGDHCKLCPFRAPCIGVQIVTAKKPRGRPRKVIG